MEKKRVAITVIIAAVILQMIVSYGLDSFFTAHREQTQQEIAEEQKKKEDKFLSDKKAPSLTLSTDRLTIYAGDVINYQGFIREAWDNLEGDIQDKVEYTTIDVNEVGKQDIVYSVKDRAGNKSEKKIRVNVKEKISFNGNKTGGKSE